MQSQNRASRHTDLLSVPMHRKPPSFYIGLMQLVENSEQQPILGA